MTVRGDSPARPLKAGFGIVAIGVLVGIITLLGVSLVRPVLVILAFGGIIVLLPTFLVRDPRAYWLFLLVLSIPFDIFKRMTSWVADPFLLVKQYGPPASGTLSFDIYLTDVVLIAMLLPWLVRLCLRRDRLFFPKVGYLFVLYLVWALIVSLTEAESLYLAICELGRQVLYFLSFVYLVNNIVTRAQLRAVVLALFLGLGIGSGSVIAFFALGIGSDTSAFSALYSDKGKSAEPTTMYTTMAGGELGTKRSMGIFSHPAMAASFFGLTVPLALAFLTAARRYRDGILFGAFVVSGCLASYLTFSRAGLVGLLVGSMVLFLAGRGSRLISQRWFITCVFIFGLAAAVSAPLLLVFLNARPESVSRRFDIIEVTLDAIWQRPIIGAGLNNSSAAIKEGARKLTDKGQPVAQSVPVHYLVVLTELGLVGFLLFFAFFGQIVMTAFGAMRAVEAEMKVLLVGIVGGLASLVTQNLGDNAFGAHAINAVFWLFAALIVVIARRVRSERAAPARREIAAPSSGSRMIRSTSAIAECCANGSWQHRSLGTNIHREE